MIKMLLSKNSTEAVKVKFKQNQNIFEIDSKLFFRIREFLFEKYDNKEFHNVCEFFQKNNFSPTISEEIALIFMNSVNYINNYEWKNINKNDFYKFAINNFPSPVFYEVAKFTEGEKFLRDIDIKKPIGFIHFPTTGGTTVKNIVKSKTETRPYIHFGHRIVLDKVNISSGIDYPDNFPNGRDVNLFDFYIENSFLFTTVRNIYEYIYSVSYRNQVDLKRFIYELLEREDTHMNRKFMFLQPFAQPSGRLIADWILRTEHLYSDLQKMQKQVPITLGKEERRNVRSHGDYRKAYTSELVDIVSENWSQDIAAYGFDFEHQYNEDYILRGDVSHLKGKVSYVWRSNRFEVLPE